MNQIRYVLAIVMAMLMVSSLQGQNTHKPQVTKAEYYIDTDPGVGKATALQAKDGKLGDAIEALFDQGIVVTEPGIHTFCVRVKDSLAWGPVFKTVFSVEAAAKPIQKNIVAGEFFWDKDPGEGNGKTLLAFDGDFNDAIESVFKTNIAIPTEGIHSFSIRVKDVSGKWSSAFKTVISIENHLPPRKLSVTKAELFWDKDPGQGQGTSLIAFDGNFNDAIESAIKSNVVAPSAGKHKLSVRVQGADGVWGSAFSTVVSIENQLSPRSIQVKMAELFWDTEPENGKGIPMLSFDGNFNDAMETVLKSNLNTPSNAGMHKLSVRVADVNGNWSPAFSTIVSIENVLMSRKIGISLLELFLDNDPGQGQGTTLVAFDGKYNDAIETALANVSINDKGIHTLGIRALDKSGVWGSVFKTTISVEEKLKARKLQIVAGELFYDTDPGEGNGTPLLSFDGNYNDALEQGKLSLNSGLLNVGKHTLNVRFKETESKWSKPFTTVVFVDACKNSPTVTLTTTSSTSFCQGDSIKLTATAGMTKYNWVIGGKTLAETGQTLNAKESGFYTAIGYDAEGCPGKSTQLEIKVTPLDTTLTFSRSTVLCDGEYVTASVKPGYSNYLWSTNATSTAISINKAGTYSVSITNNGCTRVTKPFSVVVNQNPSAPVITAGGSTTFCYGDKVELSSSTEAQYLWSTKETLQTVTITESGNYIVTAINAQGCKNVSLPFAVNVIKSIPVISSNGIASMCDGDSVKLYAGAGYTKYKWSNGDTNSFAFVKKGGDYTVTVSTNTCSFQSAAYKVSLYPGVQLPIISKNDTNIFCEGGSVTLTSSSATDNYWSNGAKTPSIVASNSGLYYVTVRNEYGCAKSSAPIQVTSISTTPVISPSGTINLCKGDSIELNAGGGYSTYKWTNGETTQKLKVKIAGDYAVTVTNSLCASQPVAAIPVKVKVNVAMDSAIVTHNGSFTFCTGEKLILKSSSAYSYEWSNGSNKDSIVVTQPGTYNVTVANSFGCKNVSRKFDVNVYPQPVKAEILTAGPLALCGGDSVKLTSSVATKIAWSTGDTSQSIWAKQSGNYFVLSSSGAGCYAKSDVTTITVTSVKPAIVAEGKTVFCKGDSVWLDAGKGYDSYYWSTGETKQRIKAVVSDTFIVQVSKNGCTRNSTGVKVTANALPAIPELTADGALAFCKGGQVSISSTPAVKYKWSNGDTTKSTIVTATKAVFVKVTDANGCSSVSNDTTVTVHPLPIQPTITASDTLNFCKGDSVLLTGDYATKYHWSNGDTTRTTKIGESGLFNITVFNSFGCSATSENAQVIVYDLPTPVVTSNKKANTFCSGDSIVLSTDVYKKYKWNDGDTANFRVIKKAGLFNIKVVDNRGCTNVSNTVTVVKNETPSPIVSSLGQTEFCKGDSVQLEAGIADSYLWSNGDTTRSIYVTTSGLYTVALANKTGCSANSQSTQVIVNNLPKPVIKSSKTANTICTGDSIILTTDVFKKYKWSDGDTNATRKIKTAGLFVVKVTDSKGCSDTSNTIKIAVHSAPVPTIQTIGQTEFCEGDSVEFKAGTADSYLWSNGKKSQSIIVKQTGVYNVKVSNNNGCSDSSKTIDVVVNQLPVKPSITPSGDSLKATPAFAYQWKTNGVNLQNGTTQLILPPLGQANFVVEVMTDKGCKATSEPYVWTAIKENIVSNFAVYPNPCNVSATFNLELKTQIDALSIKLFDVYGRQVLAIDDIHETRFTIERGSLAAGVYIYYIYNKNEEIVSGKLIVE